MRIVKESQFTYPTSSKLNKVDKNQLTPKPLESYPVTNLTSVVEENKPNMMVIEEPSPQKQGTPED